MRFFKKTKKKKELDQKIEQLQKIIEELSEKQFEYHINIENLAIHNPKLDQLTFQLDKIDVEELSGALNLGNNFGIQVHQKEQNQKLKSSRKDEDGEHHKKEKADKQGQFTMKQNSGGFNFKLKK